MKNEKTNQRKQPTLEKMTADHIGLTVTQYRKLRAEANRAKKDAQIGIVKHLACEGYTNRQIGQVMEITEATVRGILSR